MAQAFIAYGAVTAAAGWMVWSMLLPSRLRRTVAGRLSRRAPPVQDGGCDCGGACRG
jgi:hypothetical protein